MIVIAPSDVEFNEYAWTKNSGSKSASIFNSPTLEIVLTIFDVSGDPPSP